MKIAIIGVTGLVGSVMLKVLEQRNFPVGKLILAASEKSIGREMVFKNEKIRVCSIDEAILQKPKIALFSAGAKVSRHYAPKFAASETVVIDNSSAWRMDPKIKLIVPEINAHLLAKSDKIIANPNCSTIQLLVPLLALHKQYSIRRIVVSTYQSVSGTGASALKQLESERRFIDVEKTYPHQIYKNCLPHCDDFTENFYTKEENKLVNETQKILDPNIRITATAVRVPVVGGHSESVNVEFENDFEILELKQILQNTPGVSVMDEPEKNIYPMPILAEGKDEIFVGRIRRDFSQDNSLNLWIVADNLRKGAATNAIQIAEHLIENVL